VPTNLSAMALARGARIGVLMTRRPSPAKTASKDEVNFASPSRSKNFGHRHPLGEVRADVPGLLGHPVPRWLGGHAGEANEASVVLDEEQDVEASEQEGVHVEEVTGDQALRLEMEELSPGRT